MNIEQMEHGSKGVFLIKENNQRLAEMTYSKAGDHLIIIDHTEVSDALRGKGAGKQLVTAAVNYAREKKIKILPLCPFAKAVFDKTQEFSDVLSN
jgi:predicted GNAT family acetyltransferase